MEKPKIVYHTLENWDGKTSNGYYSPFTHEIHLLRGKDLEEITLMHEQIHANRRDKLTFKFAQLLGFPMVTHFLSGLLLVLAIAGFFTSLIPFFFTGGVYGFLLLCHMYEEAKADYLVSKSIREIKKLNEAK